MSSESKFSYASYRWLDSLAISMSIICAVHCLLTPLLIVFLPILATTFWVHEDFHLWMILFVIPTTSLAVFAGCRKHKDKAVFFLSMIGVCLLAFIAFYEAVFASELALQEGAHCANCAEKPDGNPLMSSIFINVLGGIFLASGHVRNYLLCRKSDCNHDHD